MVAILEGRDPATVEDAYASTRKSDGGFRPSVPNSIEAPAKHISMTSEKIEMPPLEDASDESSPAAPEDAPAQDGAEKSSEENAPTAEEQKDTPPESDGELSGHE